MTAKTITRTAKIRDLQNALRTAKPARFWENLNGREDTWAYDQLGHNIMLHIADRDKILEILDSIVPATAKKKGRGK